MKTKVYKSASIIPNSGYGLFAKKPIKKGEIIVEFKGKLKYDSDETVQFILRMEEDLNVILIV